MFLFYVYGWFAHMWVCMSFEYLVLPEARRGMRFPASGVTDDCELLCGHWELNSGAVEEWQVLLTTKPSFQT